MRKKDAARLTPLRMLKAAFMNKSVEKGHDLDDAEARQVVNSLVKQRKDSIEQFTKGGRQDLADKEAAEITDPRNVSAARPSILPSSTRPSPPPSPRPARPRAKDMGRVMKAAMARLAGQSVDGKAVNELVRRKLGA